MRNVAARMEYYGGLNAEIVQHGREMDRAADTARGWAKNIRIKNFAAGGGTDEPHLNAEL